MKTAALVAAAFALCASTALAADARLDPAVKAIAAVGGDPGKLKTYCQMTETMASGETEKDDAKVAEIDKKIEGYLKDLGPDFSTAWSLGEEFAPDSADGKALGVAVDALDAKCQK